MSSCPTLLLVLPTSSLHPRLSGLGLSGLLVRVADSHLRWGCPVPCQHTGRCCHSAVNRLIHSYVIHILSPLSILSNSICVHLISTVSTGSLPIARETPFPFRNLSPPFYFTLPFSLRTLRGWHFPKKLRTFLPSAFLRALSHLDFDFVFLILFQSLLIHAGSSFLLLPFSLPCRGWVTPSLFVLAGVLTVL